MLFFLWIGVTFDLFQDEGNVRTEREGLNNPLRIGISCSAPSLYNRGLTRSGPGALFGLSKCIASLTSLSVIIIVSSSS